MPQIESPPGPRQHDPPAPDVSGRDPGTFIEHSQSGGKDPRLELVERIAGSRHFRKSSRLVHFLFYVVQREVDGRDNEISEQQIGVHVFGRSATYNPGDDNIVRAYARNLRSRLGEYYRGEGKDDDLLIEIPRGAYRPIFLNRKAIEARVEEPTRGADPGDELQFRQTDADFHDDLPMAAVGRPRTARSTAQIAGSVAIVAILLWLFSVLCYQAGQKNVMRVWLQKDHAFWTTVFNNKQDTLIVPGDSSLVLLEGVTRQTVTPDEYERKLYDTGVASKLGANSALIANLAQRPYTSIVDLQAATRLELLPEVIPDRTHIRFARDLHIEDLRSSNVILLGSSQANPWVQLFDGQLDFHVTYQPADGGYRVWNSNPRQGEKADYGLDAQGPEHHAYALVAFVPNLAAHGHVLLIEGTSMAGTQAAMDFLFNEDAMQSLVSRSRKPDGSEGNFEVLLETMDVGSRAAGSSILAERTGAVLPGK